MILYNNYQHLYEEQQENRILLASTQVFGCILIR